MFKRGWRRLCLWFRGHRLEFVVATLGILLMTTVLAPSIVVVVPPGSVGVLWHLFGGTVHGFYYGEGIKLILPWDRVHVFDTRLRRLDQVITSLSGDGLPVETAVTLRYRVNPTKAAELYDDVGPDYEVRLLEPSVSSQVSDIIVAHRAAELYALTHSLVENTATAGIDRDLHSLTMTAHANGDVIEVLGFTMRKITLPVSVQGAIDDKVSAQQVAEQYRYIIERERLESERKAIEAEGVRQFQSIVSSNISDTYLRWRGIDATLKLAESPNSKVVVIGSGQGGLPLILGDGGPGAVDSSGKVHEPISESGGSLTLGRRLPSIPGGPLDAAKPVTTPARPTQ